MEKLRALILLISFTNISCYYFGNYYNYNNWPLYNHFQMCFADTRYGGLVIPCSDAQHLGCCPALTFCPFFYTYPYYSTCHLQCYSDWDCPSTHKCCIHLCYQHKVCLPTNSLNPPKEVESTTTTTSIPTTSEPTTLHPTTSNPTTPKPTTTTPEPPTPNPPTQSPPTTPTEPTVITTTDVEVGNEVDE